MSLAKLTSISTQTLSLLLERQRLSTLENHGQPTNNLHIPQITRNLAQLRTGIQTLMQTDPQSAGLLRNQYERMRLMLGSSEQEVPSMAPPPPEPRAPSPSLVSPPTPPPKTSDPVYTPYTDDPEAQWDADEEPAQMMHTQRRMMNEQDTHLDLLSHSINRQRDISLQINDELEVHTGLLETLDTDMDETSDRMTAARRRLDKVAQGAKEHSSTVAIASLILILLLLIIVFKT